MGNKGVGYILLEPGRPDCQKIVNKHYGMCSDIFFCSFWPSPGFRPKLSPNSVKDPFLLVFT